MEKTLNHFLADLVVGSHKLQGLHWYVKGKDFFPVHAHLDTLYSEVRDMIDEAAEVMLMCGMKPMTTLGEFEDASHIEQKKAGFVTSDEAYKEAAKDYAHLLDCAKDLKKKAEEDGVDIVSIKCDTFIETLSKTLWMLEQR